MIRLLILVIVLSPIASAQTLLLNGGGGTLFQGEAVSGSMYTPTNTYYLAAGVQNNHPVLGASDEFLFHGYDTVVGTKSFGFSAGGVGIGLSLLGVTMTKRTDEGSISGFVGATGSSYSLPIANGMLPQHGGAGIFLEHRWKQGLYIDSLNLFNGGEKSFVQGIGYRRLRRVDASLAGGWIMNRKFVNAQASYSPISWAGVFASHQSLFYPYPVTGNAVGGGVHYSVFHASANLNESNGITQVLGKSISVGGQFKWLSESSTYYQSTDQALLNHTISETFRHWSASEGITQSARGDSFTGGVSWHNNRGLSVSVNRGITFLLNGRGYQTVTSGSLTIRIHDLQITSQEVVDPYGKVEWSGTANTYVQTGLVVMGGRVVKHRGGKYLYRGVCMDGDKRLEGCAVLVGKDLVFSNLEGEFSVHSKNRSETVKVSLEDFNAAGHYVLMGAPDTAQPDKIVIVNVRRVVVR